ncbi:polyketide synthase [Ideonella sp. BN130291]|uniref:polyketide synthase n=1 Tax=Ideonella sp. BN130291 TaxID=3112940 RepID=UPI002E260FAF|nr:polyketide synthase [Ideonella sp. BN130291]MED5619068.1 beta-ketoacyl synthase N-terminal-like domain-containing protein [Ideonella sp. BN130291]
MTSKAVPQAVPAPIAIIGMACIFPQAPDLQAFWNNILNGVDAVGEPVERWDAQRYLESGRIKTQHGGYLKDLYRFDPREFGIMPNSMDGGEPDQFLALRVARDALADAGYLGSDVDHTDTGVILGHSTYLHRGQVTVIQNNIVLDQTMALVKAALPHLDDAALAEIRETMRRKLPPTNADTAPGLVPNVMTGRIANRLNLRGPNYLVDAACSSSLLAVGAAIDELRAGRSRMMLAGGVNASLPADVSTIFTQLGALSARGRVRPFEAGSDGTLLGEGLGVVVLKRLEDALSDGDRLYAVLRGVGQSSDGRGTGLLAPSHDGETLAIRRTYQATGVDPASIGLVEAHGTGIPLGDKTEIASLKSVFGERDTPIGTKALGSVKSMISHCIPAAGVASLIKMSLAVHHKVLPPTLCEQVNPELGIDKTPFYINTRTAPWIAPLGQPRRAAVNAFGFGGTNSHAIVEQAPEGARVHKGLTAWPVELCVLSADTAEALIAKLQHLAEAIARNSTWRIAEVAAALARADAGAQHRLAIVAKDLPGLAKTIAQVIPRLRDPAAAASRPRATRGAVAYASRRVEGKLAFLFPGEGSQYPEMFADLALCFDEMQEWLDFWHGLYGLPVGQTRTDIVFPSCEVDGERRKQLEHRMHDMDVGSESVFIGGMAMHELLVSLGVHADVMVGHSSGESAALGASGANPARTPQERAACISQHYEAYERLLREGKIPTGALLAVGALPPDAVEAEVAAVPDVVIAMDNCSNQMVLYGPPEGIAAVQKRLGDLGGICLPLPFDRGYHTAAFADASAAFHTYYKNVKLGVPKVPLYSCASADLFPGNAAAVRKLAAAQWSQKVRFRETVLKMHDDGVRLFLEVGPSGNLTSFVNDILIDREFVALASNARRKGGMDQLLAVLGQLYVAGRGPTLERLFERRAIAAIDFDAQPQPPRGVLLDNTMPMVRLSDADRATVHRLASAPAAITPAAPAPATPAPSATPATRPTSAMPTTQPGQGEALPAAHSQPVADDRERVMGEYFDLMRGFLDQQRALVERLPMPTAAQGEASPVPLAPPAQPAWPSSHASNSVTPLLDEVVEIDDLHVLARCRVSLLNDAFIRDHVMSGPVSDTDPELFGLSCVPFTVSLEVMAEACALLAGRVDVKVIENVKAFDWVALDDGELSFEVRAEVIDRAQGHYAARVLTARGPVLTAEFRFEADWRLPGVAPLVERRESYLNSPHLYATGMFHGPVFQSMTYVDAWDDSGIDVELSDVSLSGFFTAGHAPRLVLNPVLLDAMGQVVACWLVQYVGTEFHAFPSTIERIELYEPCPADYPGLTMRMRQQPVDGRATAIGAPRAWHLECVDAEGQVLMRGQNLINLFFQVPTAYHEVRMDPLNGWLGAPLALLEVPGLTLWEVPLMSEEFCAQSGAICMRILAHAVLGPVERDEWRALQGHLRRRREWLFGRAALKEAVRAWVHQQTGHLLYPTDIWVRHDQQGAPVVGGLWTDTLIAAPQVSLSHNANACLVALAAPDQPVGVDLEELGRIRQPELLVESLADAERPLVAGLHGEALDERLLRLWCAKEAASKCLGIGLQGQPSGFVVERADAGFEKLVVRHAMGAVETRVVRRDRSIVAVASQEHRGLEVHA